MKIFNLYTKQNPGNDVIEQWLGAMYSIDISKVVPLLSDSENVDIRYYFNQNSTETEFNCGIVLFIDVDLILKVEIYNELPLALSLSRLIQDDVVFTDYSNDPTRWILVNSLGNLFVADEQFIEGNDYSFVIDRITMKQITRELALSVLPGREYIVTKEYEKLIYFNKDEKWNQLLDRP